MKPWLNRVGLESLKINGGVPIVWSVNCTKILDYSIAAISSRYCVRSRFISHNFGSAHRIGDGDGGPGVPDCGDIVGRAEMLEIESSTKPTTNSPECWCKPESTIPR